MSGISIDQLISVNDNVVGVASTRLSLAGLFLTRNSLIPINDTQRVLKFSNSQMVADYFGPLSDEYKYASIYFKGSKTSTKKPDYILFARFADSAQAPFLQGGAVTASLDEFKAINKGTITFIINHVGVTVADIDLSSCTSYSDVGANILAKLQLAANPAKLVATKSAKGAKASAKDDSLESLNAATLTYNALTKAFRLDTGMTGSNYSVSFTNNTPLAELLKFRPVDGGFISNGIDKSSASDNMQAIIKQQRNWTSFTPIFDLGGEQTPYDQALDLASWCDNQPTRYTYVLWTNEDSLTLMNNQANIKQKIDDAGYQKVTVIFGGIDTASFMMGLGAGINYQALNGAIDFAYKQQDGLAITCSDGAKAQALIDKRVNFYGNYNSSSNNYTFFQKGFITGKYNYINNFYNEVWLIDEIQNRSIELFATVSQVENNPGGYALIRHVIDGIMDRAAANRVIAKGLTFDNETTTILSAQAGFDITQSLTQNGYFVQITQASSSDRVARIPPQVTLWYSNGGVILDLDVSTYLVF